MGDEFYQISGLVVMPDRVGVGAVWSGVGMLASPLWGSLLAPDFEQNLGDAQAFV